MSARLVILGVAIVVLGFLASSSLYTVSETQQALVLQFGEPVREVQEPGLHAKLPLIQQVTYYEDRVLDVDPPAEQVILSDQRRLDVDAFIRYRIVDPLQFFQTARDEAGIVAQLTRATNSALRGVLGNVTQLEILSEQRADIMDRIRAEVENQVNRFGIEIVDVRIVRADVPEDTVQSVFDRMRSEREREAAEFRAQGAEQAQQIRARAERERTVLIAEAQREAQILRGQGDQLAIEIQARAYSQAPEFFEFYRSLEAYRTALGDEATTMVLSPSSQFFQFFGDMTGGAGVPPPAPATVEDVEIPTADLPPPPPPPATELPRNPLDADAPPAGMGEGSADGLPADGAPAEGGPAEPAPAVPPGDLPAPEPEPPPGGN